MNSQRLSLPTFIGLLLVAISGKCAESRNDVLVRLMQETKVVAVMGLPGGNRDYKGDEDAATLEIVFLDKKGDGPSRVSDNGEVIFLYKASDKTQSKLIEKAFEVRVGKVLDGA
ncbi:MAG: hypothetical protein M3Y79_12670 [Pseudomonadota bacterium]|nr:hypothetical protein [Pseudomonadota bacterium]